MFVHFVPVDHKLLNAGDDVERKRLLRGGGYQHLGFIHDYADSPSAVGHEANIHDEEQLYQRMMDFDRQSITGELLGENERYKAPPDESHRQQQKKKDKNRSIPEKLVLNIACAAANLPAVMRIISHDSSHIHDEDMNGWQPINEAVRTGHQEIVRYLIENGADIEHRTLVGGTPLWYARRFLIPGHSVIRYLEGIGAPDEGPE